MFRDSQEGVFGRRVFIQHLKLRAAQMLCTLESIYDNLQGRAHEQLCPGEVCQHHGLPLVLGLGWVGLGGGGRGCRERIFLCPYRRLSVGEPNQGPRKDLKPALFHKFLRSEALRD